MKILMTGVRRLLLEMFLSTTAQSAVVGCTSSLVVFSQCQARE